MRLAVLENPLREDGGVLRIAAADGDKDLASFCIRVKPGPRFVSPEEAAVPNQPKIDTPSRHSHVEASHVP